jgi:hypothetical protein
MRDRGLQFALMCLGIAVTAYAGCSVDSTTGGIIPSTTSTTTSTSSEVTSTTTTSTTSTASGMTTSGTATTGSSTSTGGGEDNLGLACAADGDCGPNLKCLTADANVPALGGGPAAGYCSKDCKTDTDCPGLDQVCLSAGTGKPGVCLLPCTLGPALANLNDPLDPAKCQGREDVRCTTLNTAATVFACVPSCGRDDQCPAGLACDQRTAVCVAKPNTGLPLGAKCDQGASPPQCAGTCVSFGAGVTMCSSPCVLGGEIDLNDTSLVTDCGGLDKGICIYSTSEDSGAGDLGICAGACKAHDDCQNPSFWCRNVGLPDNGYCVNATACPNGTGCTGTSKCTDTKYGKFCLDKTYPLGDAAPVTTTSSSSSSGSGTASTGSMGVGGSTGSTSSTVSGAGGGSAVTSTSAATGAGGMSGTTGSTGQGGSSTTGSTGP